MESIRLCCNLQAHLHPKSSYTKAPTSVCDNLKIQTDLKCVNLRVRTHESHLFRFAPTSSLTSPTMPLYSKVISVLSRGYTLGLKDTFPRRHWKLYMKKLSKKSRRTYTQVASHEARYSEDPDQSHSILAPPICDSGFNNLRSLLECSKRATEDWRNSIDYTSELIASCSRISLSKLKSKSNGHDEEIAVPKPRKRKRRRDQQELQYF